MSDIQERYAGAVMNTFGPPQLALVRGRGAHVWDADGNELIDFMCSWGPILLGHHHLRHSHNGGKDIILWYV